MAYIQRESTGLSEWDNRLGKTWHGKSNVAITNGELW